MAAARVCIDGSILEGGGQILRSTAALSCLLCKAVTINNIRAGRSKPGLKAQHLQGLQLLRDICGGQLHGGRLDSLEVSLEPGPCRGGHYVADTRTAGSVTLLLQAVLPCLLYADTPSRLTLRGGTNADMAPPVDYLTWVLQPLLEKFGVKLELDLKRRGFFPKGGGELEARVTPLRHISPVTWTERGDVTRISGLAYTAGALPKKVADAMARTAQAQLARRLGNAVEVHIDAVYDGADRAVATGSGVLLRAHTSGGYVLGAGALGKRGARAEDVGAEAATALLAELDAGGCVDSHAQDQVVMLMTLAAGRSEVMCGPITLHTRTVIHISETLTEAKFDVKELEGGRHLISCEGIHLQNSL